MNANEEEIDEQTLAEDVRRRLNVGDNNGEVAADVYKIIGGGSGRVEVSGLISLIKMLMI